MSDTSFTIDAKDVRGWATAAKKAPVALKEEMRKAVGAVSAQGAAFAISEVQSKMDGEGGLAASITANVVTVAGDSITGGWTANKVYAAQREFGGPIYPKYKKLLSWIDKGTGERVFAKMVNQKATPYMRPARDKLEPLIPVAFRKAVRNVLDGLK